MDDNGVVTQVGFSMDRKTTTSISIAVSIALSGGVVQNTLVYERILESSISTWLKAEPEDYMQRVLA